MGRRGPQPLPTAVKASRGTLRPCRANEDEPTYEGPAELAPPAGLTDRGRVEWVDRVGDAVRMGVVQRPDLPTLRAYCEAINALDTIEARIQRARGDKKIALIDRKNKTIGQFLRLARELGFTPSSRSGVKAAEAKPENKVSSFLRAVK